MEPIVQATRYHRMPDGEIEAEVCDFVLSLVHQAVEWVEACNSGSLVWFSRYHNLPGLKPEIEHKSYGMTVWEDDKWYRVDMFSGEGRWVIDRSELLAS